jgi:alpha-ribazole phosphatase/probable phosphoglycerate mutase
MQVTLLRHGAVASQYQGSYIGWLDVALSEDSYKQIKQLKHKLQDEHFDAIYCSDLKRAKDTLAHLCLTPKPHYTPRLREKSWGRHEGMRFEEIIAEGIEYQDFQQWINALDGEPMESFQRNLASFIEEEILSKDYKKILIVTHSGVIKMLLHLYCGYTLQDAFATTLPYTTTLTIDL